MKRKIIAVMLTGAILCGSLFTGGIIAAAASSFIPAALPIVELERAALGIAPAPVTEARVSTFTADYDYTIKSGVTASLLYDMDTYTTVYDCDFNDGEVLEAISGGSGISNENGKLVMAATSANRMVSSENLVDNICDFDMSFDVGIGHTWTNAIINFRGSQMSLNMRGDTCAGSDKKYMILRIKDADGERDVATYNGGNVNGKRIRINAEGRSVRIYVADELAIDYTVPHQMVPAAGYISLFSTECRVTYDNILITTKKNAYDPENDSYFQLDLGENVELKRRINGVVEQIAAGETLEVGKTYHFRVIRNKGDLQVLADGKSILSASTEYPCEQDGVSLWNGLLGISSTDENDTISNFKIYNSANLNFANDYAELAPIQTQVNPELSIIEQGITSLNNASIAINIDNFNISSPTDVNAYAVTSEFLNQDVGDVYISFDVRNSRNTWSYDRYYFAGYEIRFNCGAAPSACAAFDASGNQLICNDTYLYYGMSYYTIELIKVANTVKVYYYPVGGERTLLFTDSNCAQAATNLTVRKQQGTLTFKNFIVYDAYPDITPVVPGLLEESEYILTDEGVGCVPMGTSVRELKANLLNGSAAAVSRNGTELYDTDTVLSGDTITYEDHTLSWLVGTYGDLNGDGDVDVRDLYQAKKYVQTGTHNLTDLQIMGADLDQDGSVTMQDVDLIRRVTLKDENMCYMKRSIVGDALFEHCKLVGRQVYFENEGVSFEWTAANITVGGYMRGDVNAIINFDLGSEMDESAINIVIDGDTDNPVFMLLKSGVNSYTVAEDLEAGLHTVQIFKNNESSNGSFLLQAIEMEGTPIKPADSERKIEFLGDSITGGCGIQVTESDSWSHYSYNTYASVAARLLGADYACIANSGWGFAGYLKNPYTISRIYENATDKRTPVIAWDFSLWQPDVVVVNLGTNDNTVISNNFDNPNFNNETKYKEAVISFLTKIRNNNPNATIIWTYGAMGYGVVIDEETGRTTGDWIKEAVEAFNQTDGRTSFYRMASSQNGGGGHPDVIGSRYLGMDMARYISSVTGWDVTLPQPKTYTDGQVIADYTFDDSIEGFIGNRTYAMTCVDGRMRLDAADNKVILTSGFTDDPYLTTYEMTMDIRQVGPHDWNRNIIVLRSPNSSLSNGIYLTFLGNSMGPGNYYNPLKIEDKIQLVSGIDGKTICLGSMPIGDFYDGKTKRIYVKMSQDRLEVTIYNADDERPVTPTFSVPLTEENAVSCGDLFLNGFCTTFEVDNIKVIFRR